VLLDLLREAATCWSSLAAYAAVCPTQPNPPLLSPRRGVYTTYKSLDKAPTPRWVLAIGGFGLVVGLATYGYKMIQVGAVGGGGCHEVVARVQRAQGSFS